MPDPRSAALRERVSTYAENRPGVYTMYGPGGELLYVGKSVRVRSRLLSYFTAPRGEKGWMLIRDTARIEWEYVPNEFDALLREMRAIRRHRPRFNVEHKRKRRYAFVKVTREPAPRILPTARVVDDGSVYFGPFPKVRRTAETVRELSYVMRLRDCPGTTPVFFDDQLELFGGGGRERSGEAVVPPRSPLCLRADLGTCLAPCCGRTSSTAYRDRVEASVRFLEGRGKAPLREIDARMADAVRRRKFEYADTLKERRERLARFQEELAAWRGRVESLTFVYRVPGHRSDDRIYVVRRGLVIASFPHPKSPADRASAAARVRETLEETARADGGALEASAAGEILFVARWFRIREKELERTTGLDAWLAGAERGRCGS